MSKVTSLLLRRVDHREWGVYGVLIGPKGPVIVTLERPALDGFGKMSSIKAGVYPCKRVQSPRFGNTFEVAGVAGRSAILFHSGNWVDDSRGCILTGTSFDPVGGSDGKVGVTGSKIAMDEFLVLLRDTDTFTLTVADF